MDREERMITIPLERLKALEAIEASQTTLLETECARAVTAAKVERLLALAEYNKSHPEAHSKRSLRYYESHKEEILAKRKVAYQAKKGTKSSVE